MGIDKGGQVMYQIFGQVINGVGEIIDFDLKTLYCGLIKYKFQMR